MTLPWLWAVFTVTATLAQTARNTMQRQLTGPLGAVGATHVRFLFGLPFAILFLVAVALASGARPPAPGLVALAWTGLGAMTQIVATALMLSAMRERSFVTTIAYTKTEPVQVAVFGLAFLGDRLTGLGALAIVVATAGVLLMSWPDRREGESASLRPALLGVASGGFFALSAIGFRGGVLALETPNFVLAATTTLVTGLAIQTLVLTVYLLIADRAALAAILRLWRPSMRAGFAGALASQFWFLGFATATAAQVRTLALIEVILAQLVSRKLFREGASAREALGMALIVVGCALILNA